MAALYSTQQIRVELIKPVFKIKKKHVAFATKYRRRTFVRLRPTTSGKIFFWTRIVKNK